MPDNTRKTVKHKNEEKTVRCPVEGCNEEQLARALHLHVLRKAGDGHGEQNEIPDDMNLDEAEEVGTREVEMDYPEERKQEDVMRLCPYCDRPFRGKHGVMIHLGQMAGRKNHPKDGPERHDLNDFPIARVDENDNVVEVIEEGTSLPATERRQQESLTGINSISEGKIRQHIKDLRDQGLDDEADKAEQMLLGE